MPRRCGPWWWHPAQAVRRETGPISSLQLRPEAAVCRANENRPTCFTSPPDRREFQCLRPLPNGKRATTVSQASHYRSCLLQWSGGWPALRRTSGLLLQERTTLRSKLGMLCPSVDVVHSVTRRSLIPGRAVLSSISPFSGRCQAVVPQDNVWLSEFNRLPSIWLHSRLFSLALLSTFRELCDDRQRQSERATSIVAPLIRVSCHPPNQGLAPWSSHGMQAPRRAQMRSWSASSHPRNRSARCCFGRVCWQLQLRGPFVRR